MIGLKAKFKIEDGPLIIKKEHVENYITLCILYMLAKQLNVIRLSDVEKLEKVLKSRQQKMARQGNILINSSSLF